MMLPWASNAIDVKWVFSTDSQKWQDGSGVKVSDFDKEVVYDMIITPYKQQQMLGWGGCFGELGWDALQKLSKKDRNEVMKALFGKEGAAFSYCRIPIGANDFARNWYSLDDTPGDYDLKHFSIKRDKKCLIPYIKSALAVNPDLKLWACPWSPPTWMKTNNHYANKANDFNGLDPQKEVPAGTDDQVIQTPQNLDALSRYLCRFITEYKKAGVNISMIMFQNEPYTFNIWPNTSWKPSSIANFISNYLGPRMAREHKDVELWHGTMNTSNYDELMTVLADPKASKYLTGSGYQWEGKDVLKKIRHTFHDMPMMCTENECGNGSYDWAAAEHTWDLVKTYLDGGCGAFMYFNMVLADKGTSSWGWDQNALVRVDSKTRTTTLSPEYYLMKHLSHFVPVGSHKLKLMGNDDDSLAFLRPDGTIVLFVANKQDHDRDKTVALNDQVLTFKVHKKSFNTFIITK